MRRLLWLAAAVAILALGWFAFQVARAQLAPPNLLAHLESLVVLAWVALITATIAASLRPRRGASRDASDPTQLRPDLQEPPSMELLIAPDVGLPVAMDRPVLLVGATTADHIHVELTGHMGRVARVERRGGAFVWVPDPASRSILRVDGQACDGAVVLHEGARLDLRFGDGIWMATIKGAGR